jgi:uncharacterized membrane protein YbaN (DUF454 family)
MRRVYWRIFCGLAIALGLIGVVVPGLPTVPFMILAAWAASKGWPEVEVWLLSHKRYGPHIVRWRERGAIPRQAKLMAGLMMLASLGILYLSGIEPWLILAIAGIMGAVLLWMATRPE